MSMLWKSYLLDWWFIMEPKIPDVILEEIDKLIAEYFVVDEFTDNDVRILMKKAIVAYINWEAT